MFKTSLNAVAPILAMTGGDMYGIGADRIGTALLIIMALAVILNQLWTLFDKARRAIRHPELSLTGLASTELCELRHKEIEHMLAALAHEDARQDRINKEQFQTVTAALVELRHEMREEFKSYDAKTERMIVGLHKRSDAVLQAVSRLEGKVNQ